jgi:O-acetylhomoserine/O-acetylserine sulfhydrylase-like pyridoxal-dependent enzyme
MKLVFSSHALKRMFQRGISTESVRAVLDNAQVVAEYVDDKPYASALYYALVEEKPLHVLAAETSVGETIIITVYQPDPALWTPDFLRRKP